MDSDEWTDDGCQEGGSEFQKRKRQGTPEKTKRIRGESSFKSDHREQRFRKEWQSDSRFKEWILPVHLFPKRAQCKFCRAEMNAEISVLKRHASSAKHLQLNKSIGTTSGQRTLDQITFEQASVKKFQEEIKVAEIRKCAFLAENNIAIRAIGPLIATDKVCYADSKVAQAMQLGRTKATLIINNVIGPCHLKELAENLTATKFSVLIDESTDVSSIKSMVVNVRYHQKHEIVTKFWKLLQVFSPDDPDAAREGASARRLFDKLIQSFTEENVPLQNIVGFGSDGCNTMFGAHNSVAQKMQELLPGVTLQKCICHSLHLCASEACKELPRCVEDLARNIYGVFKSSSKRQAELKEFQEFAQVDPHKILKPAQTRWLSLMAVVNRILEQWDPLKSYFTLNAFEERLVAADSVLTFMRDPTIKLYFLFLQCVLPKFVDLNEVFQSDRPLIAVMHKKMSTAYRDLLSMFLEKRYVDRTPLENVDPLDSSKYIPVSQLYLGVKVMRGFAAAEVLDRPDKAAMEDHFRKRCRSFLVKGCSELRKRFDFSSGSPFARMSCLMPSEALSNSRPASLLDLIEAVPRICDPNDLDKAQILDDQWRLLPSREFAAELKVQEPDGFWSAVRDHKDVDGKTPFEDLGRFALSVLSLPHSNASCERCFSKVNLLKTKLRNRLLLRTINGLLLASQCAKDGNGSSKFNVTKEMIAAMKSENLKPKKIIGSQETQTVAVENQEMEEIDASCDVIFV